MKIKYIIYALLIIAVGSLVAYRIVKNKSATQSGGPVAGGGKAGGPTPVDAIVVKPVNFSNTLSVTGTIDANEQVQIRGEVSGLIRGIYFEEGSNVKKGQTLLKINDIELQAQLAQALTREKLASQTEYRAGELLKKEAISKEEYDIAFADLKALQSQTELIRAQISKTSIIAPFSGRIGLRSVSVGEYLTPETIVATLVNINPVKITFSAPEKYSGQIKINTIIDMAVAGSEKTFKASVYAIEPAINTTTRTLQLRAKAANPAGELLPGSFANIKLPLSVIENAVLVPTQSIIPILEGQKVFISRNGQAKEVKVQTGTRTDKNILITSGINAGDTVLTTGTMSLKPNTPLRLKIVDYNPKS